MATPPNPAMGAAPPQGGPAPSPGAGGIEPNRALAAITKLASVVSKASPNLSPEMEQIAKSATDALRKIVGAQQQPAPQAPPV